MNYLEPRIKKHINSLVERCPMLSCVHQDIVDTYSILEECYKMDYKFLIASNGGSAADSEHIAGSL